MPVSRPTPAFPSVSTRSPFRNARHVNNNEVLPFPPSRDDGRMTLEEFFGAAAVSNISRHGELVFHMVGDTGVGTTAQESVARAMARDIDADHHELGASFMVNLGDVLYGDNKKAKYADRFYRVYDEYDRLVFAIPGNHDGETNAVTDPVTLEAFLENFCQPTGQQPPLGQEFGVLMPNQPGPYWHLEAPFIDIIGLYSNKAEDMGILKHRDLTSDQMDFLVARLKAIATARKNRTRSAALLLAVHHPPYARGLQTSNFGHPGSPEMLADIDAACAAAGVLPDAVIAGHTHSYQRYMRTQRLARKNWTIPYLIVGTGGIGLQKIPAPIGVRVGDVMYANAFQAYGFLRVTVSKARLVLEFVAASDTHRDLQEQITIDLATHQVV